jgi:hypothetical protein
MVQVVGTTGCDPPVPTAPPLLDVPPALEPPAPVARPPAPTIPPEPLVPAEPLAPPLDDPPAPSAPPVDGVDPSGAFVPVSLPEEQAIPKTPNKTTRKTLASMNYFPGTVWHTRLEMKRIS